MTPRETQEAIETLETLSDSSRKTLIMVAQRLAHGFTGRIELECNQGGVRQVKESVTYSPSED